MNSLSYSVIQYKYSNMTIDYNILRKELFGKLNQKQVEGIELFLNAGVEDKRWLAYILATVFHETARTMQPIEEFGKGKGHEYGTPDPLTKQTYYGRGYVQLTWKDNYQKFGNLLGLNLVNKPELALDPDISLKITLIGMEKGLFRPSHSLGVYFNETNEDWINARLIINGKRKGEKYADKAELIADQAKIFYKALKE